MYLANENIIINKEESKNEKNYIFYNIDEDRIFVLNESAYEIYSLIQELKEREKVCDALKSKYDLDELDVSEVNLAIDDLIMKEVILEKEEHVNNI